VNISFRCDSCSSNFTVDEKLAGRTGRCTKCGHRIVIPAASAASAKTAGASQATPASARRFVSGSEPAERRKGATSGHSARQLQSEQSAGTDHWSISRVALKPITIDQLPAVHDDVSLHVGVPSSRVSTSVSRGRPTTWQDAVNGTVRLKPIPVERVPAMQHLIKEEDDGLDEDSTPYHLAKEIPPDERPKRSRRPPSIVTTSYHGLFRKSARILRWINESAYGISILFLMVACVGYAMQVYENRESQEPDPPKQSSPARGLGQIEAELAQADLPAQAQQPSEADVEAPRVAPKQRAAPVKQSKWTIIGITGIVVLNFVRLIAGLANLVVIPFEKNVLTGVLFLIPPFTFVHIWRHWNKLRNPVRRVIGPAVALGLVVLAYAFVPGLSRASRTSGGFQRRLEASVGSLKSDVTRQVDESTKDARTLKAKVERRLPGDLERAKTAAQKIGNQAQSKVQELKNNLPEKVDQIQKAGENVRDRVQKSVDQLTSPKQSTPDASPASPANNPEKPNQPGP
jgi:predicted Zn finger-like uncharacterized protein